MPKKATVVTVKAGCSAGIKIEIDPRAEKYYWTGQHEVHVQELLSKLLRPRSVFWDVGAHVGFMSLLASRLVGPAGKVVAFEPISENRRRLEANLRLNGTTNVRIEPLALSSRSGEGTMYARGSSLTWTLEKDQNPGRPTAIHCSTLDELGSSCSAPDLVKIDAEGAELEVLLGGAEMIRRGDTVFVVEFTSDQVLAGAREIMVGYEFRPLGMNHWVAVPPATAV